MDIENELNRIFTAMNITQDKLGQQFTALLRSSIKQREYLLRTGKGYKDNLTIRRYMDKLLPHINTRFTNIGAARFIVTYQTEIRTIIPAHLEYSIAKFTKMLTIARSMIY